MWKSWSWRTVVIKHRAEGTSSQRSGMSTAAGLIGLCSSVITWTALDVWGHSVMTAGLKGGDGRVHFGRIKFRNKLSNWPWNWEEYEPSISQLGHRMFFRKCPCVDSCSCCWWTNILLNMPLICVWAEWFSREMLQERELAQQSGTWILPPAHTRGNPLEVLGCIQS